MLDFKPLRADESGACYRGFIVSDLGAMALFKSLFGWLLKPLNPGAAEAETKVGQPRFVPTDTAEPAAAMVVVAPFDGTGGDQTALRIANILATETALDIRRAPKAVKVSGPGTLAQKLLASAELGREQLVAMGGDLLVWGEVTPVSTVLRFLPAVADVDGKPGSFGLGDTLELPNGNEEMAGDLLLATATAVAAPVREGRRTRLTHILEQSCDKANGFVEAPPPNLHPGQLASVLNCLGNALGMSFRLNRDPGRLMRSMAAHKAAIAQCSKADAPLVWAMCQNHLAAGLEAQSDREKSVEPLEEAAEAYGAVLETLGKGTHPHDWALAQTRLGQVYYKIAGRKGKAQELKLSTAAFEAALQVYTRQAMPARWAEVMNQMGVAMLALGEQMSGAAALEQAAVMFRSALEIRRREKTPLLWAQTANNLGAASFALAKRSQDKTLLNEAYECFEGAVEVYREHKRPKTAHVIEKNLSRVARLLDTRNTG